MPFDLANFKIETFKPRDARATVFSAYNHMMEGKPFAAMALLSDFIAADNEQRAVDAAIELIKIKLCDK